MTEDSVEMDMAWGSSLRSFFSTAYKRGVATVLRKPRVVILQNRPVTTDTQGFDVLQNANGLLVNDHFRRLIPIDVSGVVLDLDGVLEVGDVRDFFAVGAGADAVGGIANTVEAYMLVVEYIRLYLVNGAVIINRTMTLNYTGGTAQLALWPIGANEYASTTSGNVLAGQFGGVFEHGNGIETTNINGVVTAVAGRSPFPMLVEGPQLTQIASVVANIQAADLVAVHMLVRRVG